MIRLIFLFDVLKAEVDVVLIRHPGSGQYITICIAMHFTKLLSLVFNFLVIFCRLLILHR